MLTGSCILVYRTMRCSCVATAAYMFVSVVNPCFSSCLPILPFRVRCGAVFVTYAMPAIPTVSAVRSCIHYCIAVLYNPFLPVPSFLFV